MPKSSSRKRTWIIALVSLAALGVLGMVTLIGLAVYVFTSNVDFARVTPSAAETRFEEARAQFGAARPLIQLSREDGRPGLILDYAEPDRERVLLWTE